MTKMIQSISRVYLTAAQRVPLRGFLERLRANLHRAVGATSAQ